MYFYKTVSFCSFFHFCFSFDTSYFDLINPVHLSCADENNYFIVLKLQVSVKDCCAKWFASSSLHFCALKNRTVERLNKIFKTKYIPDLQNVAVSMSKLDSRGF